MDAQPSTQNSELSDYQLAFASSLGLELEDAKSVQESVLLIERSLGQKSLRELARWFLLSVLQHLQNTDWGEIGNSGLIESAQYELADEFLASDEFKQSLLTVLKDPRFRFTLLGFAKGRNPEKRILSTSTKAYRQAREILLANELVDSSQASRRGRRPAKRPVAEATAVHRRAARRSQSAPELSVKINVVPQSSAAESSPAMSEEEFVELEQAIDQGEADEGKPWTYETNEERMSLMLGILAGGGFCLFVLWILSSLA